VGVGLAVVRSLGTARRLRSPQELEDFEQELVDQYALAVASSGVTDTHVASERSVLFEFIGFLRRPVWEAGPEDADRFLAWLRKQRGQAKSTVQSKAWTLARFFDFLIARYQGDIHALTGVVLIQPIDEFNRPAKAGYGTGAQRIPPRDEEVEALFGAWRQALPQARKYLPAARDYLAASLWRRVGLRITETVMLDLRDWRPDLGEHGKLHVRFGKGSGGRGPSPAWARRATTPMRCWTGGWSRSATSSATTGKTPTPRCCPANATTDTPEHACGSATMHCAPGWPAQSPPGCRPGVDD
jgi:integrase